jgi:hypothetical protein
MKKLTRSKLIKKLDNVFSQYIRRKDSIDGISKCISCGVKRNWKELQCGHFMSRSHYSTRWEILNVGVQCISCNIFKHGQQYLFSKYLDKTYGEGTSNELLLKSQTLGKFTTKEIEEMINKYKNLLDQMD